MRRMDRYNDEDTTTKLSRSNKNKDLYQNVGTNTRYANITKDIYNSPENLPEIHRILSQAISDFVL